MKKTGKTLITLATLAFLGLGALSFGLRENAIGANAANFTDTLTAADLAATSSAYAVFSDVSKNSLALYAGKSSKSSKGGIQLRTTGSDCGIVSTSSGGTLISVTVSFTSDGANYNIDLYGKATAYSSAADLYGDSAGTKLSTISTDAASKDVMYTVPAGESYPYIGIRSSSGARYLEKVIIVWAEFDPLAPTISIDQNAFESSVGSTGTLTATTTNAGGASIVWSSSDSSVISINSSTGGYECLKMGAADLTATMTVSDVIYVSKIIGSVTATLTAAEAYAVGQALASGATTIYGVTVMGVVESFAGTGLSGSNNSIFLTAGAGGEKFQLYFGYVAVSNWSQVSAIGVTVSVYGKIQNYNNTAFELVNISSINVVDTDALAVDQFVEDFMHPEISYENYADTGACLGEDGYYDAAKQAFNVLSAAQRQMFVENSNYTNPKTRLIAWAVANSEVLRADNTFGVDTSGAFDNNSGSNNEVIEYSVLIAIVGLTSLGAIYFYRKRKIAE